MKYTIELDAQEMVELISICNSAIVSEERCLTYLSDDSAASQHCKTTIESIKTLKEKFKNIIQRR